MIDKRLIAREEVSKNLPSARVVNVKPSRR